MEVPITCTADRRSREVGNIAPALLGICDPAFTQVERMNRTIKDATLKRFHYDSHEQLRTHLADFMAAYNFARRLKTLGGLTPYKYICKICTSELDQFILDPIHQMPGLNTQEDQKTTIAEEAKK
jgi:hypothetical protein